MFRDDVAVLLSQPFRIEWDGWESNTYRLQQAGWEFSAEQDFERRRVRLAMRNQRQHMYGVTTLTDVDFFHVRNHYDAMRDIGFRVQHMASNFTVQIATYGGAEFDRFKPVDMLPTVVQQKIRSIEDFGLFAVPLVRTQEIVVPEDTVGDLMSRILELQEPGRKAYFEQQVREAGREGSYMPAAVPQRKFHAQILSLAA